MLIIPYNSTSNKRKARELHATLHTSAVELTNNRVTEATIVHVKLTLTFHGTDKDFASYNACYVFVMCKIFKNILHNNSVI